ncbi:MAG: polymer-forming cytoskeletal protein [Elusimicrobiota bacterium]
MKRLVLVMTVMLAIGSFSFAAAPKSGDRVKIGGDVVVREGETVQNAVAIMGNVTVNGTVEGNATAILGKIEVGPKGIVKANAVSVRRNVVLADGAKVFGNITEISPGKAFHFRRTETCPAGLGGFFGFFMLAAMICFMVLAALFVAVFPKYTEEVSASIDKNILKVFLTGVIGVLLIMPVMLALVVSIAGILLIPFEILFVLAAMIVGYIIAGRYIGGKLMAAAFKTRIAPVWETLIGLAAVTLAVYVPFAGVFVKIFVATLGFGAVIYSILPRKKA